MSLIFRTFRFQFAKLLLCILFVISLSHCGGGGGGGGSSGGGRGESASTGVRLLQGSIDYPRMQVNAAVPNSGIITTAAFGEPSFYGGLGTGLQSFSVSTVANPSQVLWAGSADIQNKSHRSIVVYGGYGDSDVRFNLISDSGVSIPEGQAAVRVINGAVDSGRAILSIAAIGNTEAAIVGGASPYITIPAGSYDFSVLSGGGRIGYTSGTVVAGQAYSIFCAGAAGYFVTTELVAD